MNCTINTTHSMSEFCLEAWYTNELNQTENCFPQVVFSNSYGTFYIIWVMTNAGVGLFGNLLTLLAIPYAKNKKMYICENLFLHLILCHDIKLQSISTLNLLSLKGVQYRIYR